MIENITLRRISAGHYIHDETGIEIERSDAHREHGYWVIFIPMPDGRCRAGSTKTLNSAKVWVGEPDSHIAVRREAIAMAHEDALTENDDRDVFTQNRAWIARHGLLSGRREHVNAAIAIDHAEALDINAAKHTQRTREREASMSENVTEVSTVKVSELLDFVREKAIEHDWCGSASDFFPDATVTKDELRGLIGKLKSDGWFTAEAIARNADGVGVAEACAKWGL